MCTEFCVAKKPVLLYNIDVDNINQLFGQIFILLVKNAIILTAFIGICAEWLFP